jgi:hypothetical protein
MILTIFHYKAKVIFYHYIEYGMMCNTWDGVIGYTTGVRIRRDKTLHDRAENRE